MPPTPAETEESAILRRGLVTMYVNVQMTSQAETVRDTKDENEGKFVAKSGNIMNLKCRCKLDI